MKAICKFAKEDSPRLVDIPIPKPGMKEVLVKVCYAGICKTDLKVANGELKSRNGGVILGHEFSGEVVSLGFGCDKLNAASDMKVRVGDVVSANPMLDDESDKMLGKDANGCFAEYITVPMKNIVDASHYAKHLSDSKLKALAYIEPIAAALGPVRALQQAPYYFEAIAANKIVIAGYPSDRIAKLLAMCFASTGYRVPIVSPEKLLVDHDLGEKKYQAIVECCPEFAGKLLKCLENKGVLVLKSRGYVELDNILVNDVVMRELRIVGAKYVDDFFDAYSYMVNHQDSLVKDLIEEKSYKLEEFEEAFKSASAKDAKKVMFKCVQ